MLKHVKTKYEEYYEDENGNIHGEYKAYHDNGQLQQICNYVDDKRHGEYKSYHDNGQLLVICNYVNGRFHGEYKAYHGNGKLRVICNYVDGEIQGEYKCYHDNGELIVQVFYIMSKLVDLSIHGMDIDKLSQDDINLLTVIYA